MQQNNVKDLENDDPSIKQYLQWFTGNGGFIDGVRLTQKDGLRGLVVSKPLPFPGKAVIAVPNRIVISAMLVEKTELADVIKQNPLLYDSATNSESEYNKLALFVFTERLKGEKSFYHPLFNVTPTCETIIEWSEMDLTQLGDPYILKNGLQFQRQMKQHWDEVQSVLKKHQKVFLLQKGRDYQPVYYWAYQYVMTRIFQWGQPCAVLLPYAEFQNHHSSFRNATENYCFNRNFEEAQAMIQGKPYRVKHNNIDVSLIKTFGKPSAQTQTVAVDPRVEYIKIQSTYIEDDSKPIADRIEQINWALATSNPAASIYDYDYYSSEDEEDNDSGEDEQYDYEEDENPTGHHDSDYSWYSPKDTNVYFLVVTKRPYEVGQPLQCSYGNRTSRYLLKWYGFCELNSKNDSLQFQLWLHKRKIHDAVSAKEALFLDFITQAEEEAGILLDGQRIPIKMLSTPYRLKAHYLNEDLIIYLRNLVSESQGKKLKVMSLPSDIDIEIQVFQTMRLLVHTFEGELPLPIPTNPIQGRQAAIIAYRRNRQEIIQNQLNMIDRVICILERVRQAIGIPLRDAYMAPVEGESVSQQRRVIIQVRDYIRQFSVGKCG